MKNSWGLFAFLILTQLTLSACSQANTEAPDFSLSTETSPFAMPQNLAAVIDGISGTISVYTEYGELVTSAELKIFTDDAGMAWASAPQFTLNQNSIYYVLLTYYYDAMPVGFVFLEIATSDNSSIEENYTEENIFTEPIQLSDTSLFPDFFITQNLLPDLDNNDDGISNLSEALSFEPPSTNETETAAESSTDTTVIQSITETTTNTSTSTMTATSSATATATQTEPDNDGDGYSASTDCDDTNAAVYPGATEVCNDINDDCDTSTDEGVQTIYYRDADGDGYGTASTSTSTCSLPNGYSASNTDCNDSSSVSYPNATELCTDSLDNNCDGFINRSDVVFCIDQADVKIRGAEADDCYGCTLFGGVDINHDGFDDFLIGAPTQDVPNSAGPGYLELFMGSDDPAELAAYDIVISGVSGIDDGKRVGISLGMANDFIGNLNKGDLVIGANNFHNYGNGEVFVFEDITNSLSSSAVSLSTSQATYRFTLNLTTHPYLGTSATFVGDLDNDGYSDLAAGAPYYGGSGSVFTIMGNFSPASVSTYIDEHDDVVWYGEYYPDQAGSTLSSAGDVNNDGCGDFITGAPNAYCSSGNYCGKAYLVLGQGDINCAVPAFYNVSENLIYRTTFRGINNGDGVGAGVAGIGDFDGDGYDDIAIAATNFDNTYANAGAIGIYYGSAGGILGGTINNAPTLIIGKKASEYCGATVAAAGDFNNDGYDDLLMSCQWADRNGSYSGSVYLIYGKPRAQLSGTVNLANLGSLLDAVAFDGIEFVGEAAYDQLIYAHTAGDIDGDGLGDLLFGGRYNDEGGVNAGAAYIVFGSSLQ